MADVIMPKMGDAMDTGVIVQWLKNVGDKVGPEDAVAEIETDKSNVEVTADAEGYLQKITAQPGETVPVGNVIAVIGPEKVAGDTAATAPAPQATAPAKAEEPAPAASSNGAGPTPAAVVETPAPTARTVPTPVAPVAVRPAPAYKPYDSFVGALPVNLGGSASVVGEPIAMDGGGAESVKATPVARAMAQAHNLDLSALRGSGPDGAVAKRDVEAALANGQQAVAPVAPTTTAPAARPTAPAAAVPVNEGDEVQEYNAMRRTIARRLAESKATIPHVYLTAEIDVEAMLALREQVNAGAGETQPKVTVNDFLVKATAVALGENPLINSVFSDNKRIIRKAIHIGIAVSIEDGLIVPVVRNCEAKSLRAIARETRPLIEKARAGKLTPAEYTGGTFTISNLGSLGEIDEFSAIINPGEAAILAIASARLVPAIVNGQVVPRRRMKVTLSVDHRVVDGAAGAIFLASLKRIIENPVEILA
jgi:pyruvate dehydrogenase E2 component (dihydrolipoamide acetyltransferase)